MRKSKTNTEQLGFGDLLASTTFAELEQIEVEEAEAKALKSRQWTAVCYESRTCFYPTMPGFSQGEIMEEVANALRANRGIRYIDVFSPDGSWIIRIGHAKPQGRLHLAPETDATAAPQRKAA